MWNLSMVFIILPLVVMCRVSMMVFMGPMEWWFFYGLMMTP
jgi:hypothetical protein